MDTLIEAWILIVAAVLAISGIAKLVDPVPTSGALRAMGWPAATPLVRLLGVAEIVTAAAAVVIGGVATWGLAVLYAGFAGFVVLAWRRDVPIQSCGCFGRADTPPSVAHLVVNLLSAGAGVAAVVLAIRPLDVFAGQPLLGIPYLGFVALGTWIVYLLLAELPKLGATP